jgi:hypothetical protein
MQVRSVGHRGVGGLWLRKCRADEQFVWYVTEAKGHCGGRCECSKNE